MKAWLKRYKWYLVGGTGFLAVLLVLAVIVYINMTPTLGKDANNADKIFDFLDKWASAGAPAIMLLAILVALGVGLAGIRETRSIQKNEQKQRLLNEIIEWATGVLKLNSHLYTLTDSVRVETGGFSKGIIDKLYSDTMAMRDKGKYIIAVANVAGHEANGAARKLLSGLSAIADLFSTIGHLAELSEDDARDLITSFDAMMLDKDPERDTVERHRAELIEQCNFIIDQVAQAQVTLLTR